MDYQQIIERLKLIRMRNHLSAKDLGKLLGNSYTYFYKVEDGSIILSMPKLLEVLQLLGVTTEEFFYDDFENYKITCINYQKCCTARFLIPYTLFFIRLSLSLQHLKL